MSSLASLLGAVLWPSVILVVFLSLKSEIKDAFGLVNALRGNAKSVSVEIGSLRFQVEALAAIQAAMPMEQAGLLESAPVQALEQSAQALSSAPPIERINAAYVAVKSQAVRLLDEVEIASAGELSLVSIGELLASKKRIPAPALHAIEALSALRDQANADPSRIGSGSEVDRFEQLARRTLIAMLGSNVDIGTESNGSY